MGNGLVLVWDQHCLGTGAQVSAVVPFHNVKRPELPSNEELDLRMFCVQR